MGFGGCSWIEVLWRGSDIHFWEWEWDVDEWEWNGMECILTMMIPRYELGEGHDYDFACDDAYANVIVVICPFYLDVD